MTPSNNTATTPTAKPALAAVVKPPSFDVGAAGGFVAVAVEEVVEEVAVVDDDADVIVWVSTTVDSALALLVMLNQWDSARPVVSPWKKTSRTKTLEKVRFLAVLATQVVLVRFTPLSTGLVSQE